MSNGFVFSFDAVCFRILQQRTVTKRPRFTYMEWYSYSRNVSAVVVYIVHNAIAWAWERGCGRVAYPITPTIPRVYISTYNI